jgi:hypothetical protein
VIVGGVIGYVIQKKINNGNGGQKTQNESSETIGQINKK